MHFGGWLAKYTSLNVNTSDSKKVNSFEELEFMGHAPLGKYFPGWEIKVQAMGSNHYSNTAPPQPTALLPKHRIAQCHRARRGASGPMSPGCSPSRRAADPSGGAEALEGDGVGLLAEAVHRACRAGRERSPRLCQSTEGATGRLTASGDSGALRGGEPRAGEQLANARW